MKQIILIFLMLFAAQLYFDVEMPNGILKMPCTSFIGMSKATEKISLNTEFDANIPNPRQCCRVICE